MHEVAFGEGKGLSGESANALSQGEIEPLDMICLSVLFGARPVLIVGHDFLIGVPKVGEDEASFVSGRNLLPQLAAAIHRARAMMPSDHLPGAPTQCNPQPDRVTFVAHIRP